MPVHSPIYHEGRVVLFLDCDLVGGKPSAVHFTWQGRSYQLYDPVNGRTLRDTDSGLSRDEVWRRQKGHLPCEGRLAKGIKESAFWAKQLKRLTDEWREAIEARKLRENDPYADLISASQEVRTRYPCALNGVRADELRATLAPIKARAVWALCRSEYGEELKLTVTWPDGSESDSFLPKELDDHNQLARFSKLVKSTDTDGVVRWHAGNLKSRDARIRRAAAKAIAVFGPKAEAAVPALQDALAPVPPLNRWPPYTPKNYRHPEQGDGCRQVWAAVEAAARALGAVGIRARAALPVLLKLAEGERFTEHLSKTDQSANARQAAAEAVRRIDAQAGAELDQELQRRQEAESRAAWDRLMSRLDERNGAEDRQRAVKMIAELGKKALAAVPKLVEMLRDKDVWEDAREALVCLGRANPKVVVPALLGVRAELAGVKDKGGYLLVPRMLKDIDPDWYMK